MQRQNRHLTDDDSFGTIIALKYAKKYFKGGTS
jgi:hypothetical protein